MDAYRWQKSLSASILRLKRLYETENVLSIYTGDKTLVIVNEGIDIYFNTYRVKTICKKVGKDLGYKVYEKGWNSEGYLVSFR